MMRVTVLIGTLMMNVTVLTVVLMMRGQCTHMSDDDEGTLYSQECR